MSAGLIEYEKFDHPKYKYRLTKDYHHMLSGFDCESATLGPWIRLNKNYLFLKKDYAWDGATSAIDTEDFMRGSLVHDSLYQLIAHGKLPKSLKRYADKELVRICGRDGMPWFRRVWVWLAVRTFGFADGRYNPSGL